MVFTLESIVEKLGDDIAPYAEGVAQNLVAAFFKCVDSNRDDDDFGAIAAFGCLRALNTLLDSISDRQPMFPRLEEICFPIMDRMTSREGNEVFEDVMDLVALFMYYSPNISAKMWSLWGKMHAALLDWAIDYFEYMLTPFDLFISRATEVFLNSKEPNYLASMNQVLTGPTVASMLVCCHALIRYLLSDKGLNKTPAGDLYNMFGNQSSSALLMQRHSLSLDA